MPTSISASARRGAAYPLRGPRETSATARRDVLEIFHGSDLPRRGGFPPRGARRGPRNRTRIGSSGAVARNAKVTPFSLADGRGTRVRELDDGSGPLRGRHRPISFPRSRLKSENRISTLGLDYEPAACLFPPRGHREGKDSSRHACTWQAQTRRNAASGIPNSGKSGGPPIPLAVRGIRFETNTLFLLFLRPPLLVLSSAAT